MTLPGHERPKPTRLRLRWSGDDREIWRLAWPALGALVAEPLYVLADTAIVGRIGTPSSEAWPWPRRSC